MKKLFLILVTVLCLVTVGCIKTCHCTDTITTTSSDDDWSSFLENNISSFEYTEKALKCSSLNEKEAHNMGSFRTEIVTICK